MNEPGRDELIRRYREGAAVVEKAVSELRPKELDHRPADGGWTPREVLHHLADSEMTSAIRLRKLLAEPAPLIQGYDEEEFARALYYDARPIETSLAATRAARESTASLFDHLTEEDWNRSGTHSESGPYSVQTWLEIYARHAHDHAEQIRMAADEARSGRG